MNIKIKEELKNLVDQIVSITLPTKVIDKDWIMEELLNICKEYRKLGYIEGSDYMLKMNNKILVKSNESIYQECKKIVYENLLNLCQK